MLTNENPFPHMDVLPSAREFLRVPGKVGGVLLHFVLDRHSIHEMHNTGAAVMLDGEIVDFQGELDFTPPEAA